MTLRAQEDVDAESNLPVIGLTGSIGSGKSTVATMFAEAGCIVCDSDALGRAAYGDPSIRNEIVKWWGESIRGMNGEIDRARVATIIFPGADASLAARAICDRQRRRLESLIHPWIHAKRQEQFKRPPRGTKALVIDAPLLIESNMQGACDSIVFVDAPPAVRLARVRLQRGWPDEELTRREKSQMPLDLKRQFAHHIVINDADLGSLRAQVARILSLILSNL